EHARSRQPVEQRGLARVGVADDRDRGHVPRTARVALGLAGRCHVLDLSAQLRHPGADPAAVELDLRLTRTTRTHAGTAGGDPATGLPGHRLTPSAQAREQVLELRELHLRLALAGLRVLGEDVEDQSGPVDDLDLDDVLKTTALGGREL